MAGLSTPWILYIQSVCKLTSNFHVIESSVSSIRVFQSYILPLFSMGRISVVFSNKKSSTRQIASVPSCESMVLQRSLLSPLSLAS